MEYMSNPMIAGVVGGVVAALGKMAEDKMADKTFDPKQYMKCALFVGLLVAVIVYMATSGVVSGVGIIAGAEEILTEPF